MTEHCPKCGRENEMQPHPDQPGRVVMYCECNPLGPVLEKDVPDQPKPVARRDINKPIQQKQEEA